VWELARDSGVTVNKAVECSTAIASKLAPTGGKGDSGTLTFGRQPVSDARALLALINEGMG